MIGVDINGQPIMIDQLEPAVVTRPEESSGWQQQRYQEPQIPPQQQQQPAPYYYHNDPLYSQQSQPQPQQYFHNHPNQNDNTGDDGVNGTAMSHETLNLTVPYLVTADASTTAPVTGGTTSSLIEMPGLASSAAVASPPSPPPSLQQQQPPPPPPPPGTLPYTQSPLKHSRPGRGGDESTTGLRSQNGVSRRSSNANSSMRRARIRELQELEEEEARIRAAQRRRFLCVVICVIFVWALIAGVLGAIVGAKVTRR